MRARQWSTDKTGRSAESATPLTKLDRFLFFLRPPSPSVAAEQKDVPALVWLLTNARVPERKVAAYHLGQVGGGEAVEPLIGVILAKETPSELRNAAMEALGRLRDTQNAIEPLSKVILAKETPTDLRRVAVEALGRLNHPQNAVEPLIAALLAKDSPTEVRSAAAEALGRLRDPCGLDPLIAALRDIEWTVCCSAASALELLADNRAVGPLADALIHFDQRVQFSAAQALKRFADSGALEPLERALKSKGTDATSALAKVLAEAVIALYEKGYPPDPEAEQIAMRIMAREKLNLELEGVENRVNYLCEEVVRYVRQLENYWDMPGGGPPHIVDALVRELVGCVTRLSEVARLKKKGGARDFARDSDHRCRLQASLLRGDRDSVSPGAIEAGDSTWIAGTRSRRPTASAPRRACSARIRGINQSQMPWMWPKYGATLGQWIALPDGVEDALSFARRHFGFDGSAA